MVLSSSIIFLIYRWFICVWKTNFFKKLGFFFGKQLKKKNWPGPIECKLCGQIKSTFHSFFHCEVAHFLGGVCRDIEMY
jgi:hypothetical protein